MAEQSVGKFRSKQYRDAYVAAQAREVLAKQMRNFRGDLSQAEYAAKIDKQKTVVGRLENPAYGGWSLRTMLEVARKEDVAVIVRFIDFPTFTDFTDDMSDKALCPASYNEATLDDYVRDTSHKAAQSEREATVERVNHYPLYQLGRAIRFLEVHLNDDEEVDGRSFFNAVNIAKWAVQSLIGGTPFHLTISKRSADELLKSINDIDDNLFKETKDTGKQIKYPTLNEKISYEEWMYGTRDAIAKFETLFSTEMSDVATYFVPPRGIYNTAALIDFADRTFPMVIYGHVPDKAKDDWKAAGRCLAFSLLTATGFHVARAVEATLEVYYQLYAGKSGTLNGWNDYIKALERVQASGSDPRPAERTLAELRQMKDDYRNPLAHPRVSLSESEARMLFDNGESLIIAMAQEIKTIREVGGVQGALAVVGGSALDDETPF